MRKKALAATAANVEVPDVEKTLEILYRHTKYDAMQFRIGTMQPAEAQELEWMMDFVLDFNCLELKVSGITEQWFFDKIIRDHDPFYSIEGYSVLLSIHTPALRAVQDSEKDTVEVTYNRYAYLRYFPDRKEIVPSQAFASATSDANPRWTRVIELLEKK